METDDGSRTLRDERLNETFHSGCGALSECLHVYLRNSGVEERLRSYELVDRPLRVLEFGFGTGMASLLTITAATACKCPLEYVSLEHDLLPVEVLQQLRIGQAVEHAISAGDLPKSFHLASAFEIDWLAVRSKAKGTEANEVYWQASPSASLRIVLGDAVQCVARWARSELPKFDAIYFDAFSPATNPELWTTSVYRDARSLLAEGGRLVSYCVSGPVRRGLEEAGFAVTRLPGPPGGKREVLCAK